jgi:hypothetical protein
LEGGGLRDHFKHKVFGKAEVAKGSDALSIEYVDDQVISSEKE